MNVLHPTHRYTGPDVLKLLCAFLVVCIHTESIIGVSRLGLLYLLPITRVAVPLFFMISGFFSAGLPEIAKIKQLKKVLALLLFSLALFMVFELLRLIAGGEAFAGYFARFSTTAYWLRFLLFNDPDISMHLWYLCALFYVLIIAFFAEKRIALSRLYPLIPILLILNLLLGTYASALFGKYLHIRLSRNFLFCGLPFFLLGHYIHSRRPRFSTSLLLLGAGLSLLASIAENYVILRLGRDFNLDLFFFTPVLSFCMFLLVLQNESFFASKALTWVAALGRKTSTAVFIIHPMVIHLLPAWLREYRFFAAPLVFALCTLIALALSSIRSKAKKHRYANK